MSYFCFHPCFVNSQEGYLQLFGSSLEAVKAISELGFHSFETCSDIAWWILLMILNARLFFLRNCWSSVYQVCADWDVPFSDSICSWLGAKWAQLSQSFVRLDSCCWILRWLGIWLHWISLSVVLAYLIFVIGTTSLFGFGLLFNFNAYHNLSFYIPDYQYLNFCPKSTLRFPLKFIEVSLYSGKSGFVRQVANIFL